MPLAASKPSGSPNRATHRLVLMTTVPQTLATFFQAQTRHLQESGFDVVAVSSPGPELDSYAATTGIPTYGLEMTRRLTPFRDLRALAGVTSLLATLKPDIVHTHTPKAGLLGMLGARLNGVRVRIYTINGLPWMTRRGWQRRLLQHADCLACSAATDVLCVSESLRREVLSARICPAAKVRVLGNGGSHGVNTSIFDPSRFSAGARREIRRAYGLDQNSIVVACVGRLVRDKGICELLQAWDIFAARCPGIQLLLAGGTEPHDPLPDETWHKITSDSRIRLVLEKPEDMPRLYAAADLCVLPTHREGLPNVALEAAAMGIPVIAFSVCGCTDAILPMQTGMLVELGDVASLAKGVEMLASDSMLRSRMGALGRKFVCDKFAERDVSARISDEYRRLLTMDTDVLEASSGASTQLER